MQYLITYMLDLSRYLFFWLCQVFAAACGLSLVVVSGSYPLVAGLRLSIAVAFLVAKHRLQVFRLQ